MAKQDIPVNVLRLNEETILVIGDTCIIMDRNAAIAGVARREERYSTYEQEGWTATDEAGLKEAISKFFMAEAAEYAKNLMSGDEDSGSTE